MEEGKVKHVLKNEKLFGIGVLHDESMVFVQKEFWEVNQMSHCGLH